MRVLLLRAKAADPSFAIGLGLIVTLAVTEIFAATLYYVGRMRVARTSGHSVAMTSGARLTAAPTAVPPRPQSSPAAMAPPTEPSAVDRLLQEAIELRDRGDTTNALAHLNEASERDPSNAMVLEETAKTYDLMQLYDSANKWWRRLQEIGPSAGAAYELADRRLKEGAPSPGTTGAGTATETTAGLPSGNEIDGISEGSMFGISEIKTTETPDPDAEKNLNLRIAIKKEPTAQIDQTKVKVHVFFYDTVDNKDVRLTDADVNYEWLTAKHDWTDANPEILSVTYVRPKIRGASSEATLSETAAAVKAGQKSRAAKGNAAGESVRTYLGYRILVYYDDKLQAVRAEPAGLLQLFPPSESISSP